MHGANQLSTCKTEVRLLSLTFFYVLPHDHAQGHVHIVLVCVNDSSAMLLFNSLFCSYSPDYCIASLAFHGQTLLNVENCQEEKTWFAVFLNHTMPAGAHLVVPYDLYAAALCLDGPTLANLELLEGSAGEAEGSLLAALDTCASPGKLIAWRKQNHNQAKL